MRSVPSARVADDLDIPQHVLRFWETRFTQIKPMKRSGGRRYYRPDDVDLLKGDPPPVVRRGLHHPRRAADPERTRPSNRWQGLADQNSAVSFGRGRGGGSGLSLQEPEVGEGIGLDVDDNDYENDKGIDYRFVETDEDGLLAPFGKGQGGSSQPRTGRRRRPRNASNAWLADLIACRQMLDTANKDGLRGVSDSPGAAQGRRTC